MCFLHKIGEAMRWFVLLLGLVACVPKPAVVEAPATISIPALPKPEPQPEAHQVMPRWTVQRLWNLDTEEIVVDPTQAIYVRGDSKVTVTSGRGGILSLSCEKGVKAILFCSSDGKFQFTCNDISLQLSCERKPSDDNNEIEKESETQ